MIQLVIFDMAGTAIDEDNLVYKAIQAALIDAGIELDLETVLEYGAGKEKQIAIADIIEHKTGHRPDHKKINTIYKDFSSRLDAAYDEFPIRVFPSVLKVLEQLHKKGIKVAFNTGYNQRVAQKILDKVGIIEGKDIDLLMTADLVDRSRPAPDMIHAICDKFQIAPQLAIKVGDSKIDIEEGQAAKVKYAIGITTGAQQREMLATANPDFIIDDMLELLTILEQ